jgi:transcriptional regulator with XRE-family HTH domain
MDINEATARAIAAERAISGMTVRELAARAGIPERSLMRVLQAEREIKVVQVAQLAEAFAIYPHEIVERAEVILARAERDRPTPEATVHAFPSRPSVAGTTVAEPRVIAAMEDYDGEDLVAEMESHEEQP